MKHEDRETIRTIVWVFFFVFVMGAIALWMATEPEPVFTYGYRNTLTQTVKEAR